MADWIRIFCRSARALPASQITRFIEDGVFFDVPPRFEVQPDSDTGWRRIGITYGRDNRRMTIERNIADALMYDEMLEAADLLCLLDVPRALIEQLQTSQQVIAIEAGNPRDRSAESSDMLVCLEAYLADELDGLILAPDDGLYDRQARLLYRL